MTDQLARYETAQEIFGKLIALRTYWVFLESSKQSPNFAHIQQWENEQAAFMAEDAQLFLSDSAEIDRVISAYGPEAKASYAS